jgi:hypothetical protein
MLVRGDGGSGYIRVDWFTPAGLETWGDGRLTILGTDGFIEIRKNIDLAGREGGNHLFLVRPEGDALRRLRGRGAALRFRRSSWTTSSTGPRPRCRRRTASWPWSWRSSGRRPGRRWWPPRSDVAWSSRQRVAVQRRSRMTALAVLAVALALAAVVLAVRLWLSSQASAACRCAPSKFEGGSFHGEYYEDYVLSSVLDGVASGTYVDVGANHPIEYSVTACSTSGAGTGSRSSRILSTSP